jgi:hypothetical protein
MLTIKKNNKGSPTLIVLVKIVVMLIYKDLKVLILNVFYKDK